MPEEPVAKVGSGSTPVADLSEAKTQEDANEAQKPEKDRYSIAKDQSKTQPSSNYLQLLPADWSTMHWVKKEKFVMGLTDYNFVKFILTVESLKAVQIACKKRLAELLKNAKTAKIS